MNKHGNMSKAKSEAEIVEQARQYEDKNMSVTKAALALNVGIARFSKIVDKHKLKFRRGQSCFSEEQILAAVREHGAFESENTIAKMLGASHQRVAEVAAIHGLELQKLKATPDRVGFVYDEKGYATKRCSKCGEMKGAEHFDTHPHHVLTGLASWCRPCVRAKAALMKCLERLPI